MSLISDEMKSESEVYYGDEICQVKSQELLEEMCLPKGLLPLKNIIEVGHHRETGFVWLKQKNSITHKFEKIGKVTSYATEVTSYVEKVIFMLNPPTGKITFQTPAGLSRTFPVSAFEIEEKSSGVKEV
ncbi:unnamed protein product [Vicia faba]|uniref:Uncharacterized protein n=1 Tax=Vicia faba TaxID=3906 RepID=A0AAV1B431_VICFA|nr:unnamed protein product [Vicia faba]